MKTHALVFLTLGALALMQESPAEESLRAALARCMDITRDAARLRCYDETAAHARTATSSTQTDNAAGNVAEDRAEDPAGVARPAPLDDSVGRNQVAGNEQEQTYGGTLVRCEERGPSDKTYFYLEGGQVWRQNGGRRLRLGDCSSEIEISQDWFGFKLRIINNNRTIRVSRVR